MPPVRPVRLAVVVLAATAVHDAPPWSPWYHQAAVWLLRVSVAVVSVTALAASVAAAVLKATSAILLAEAQPLALYTVQV